MRALLVGAGLLFVSACTTANTQPVPARDSVEAEHQTVPVNTESAFVTQGGGEGTRGQTHDTPADPPAPISDEEAWTWRTSPTAVVTAAATTDLHIAPVGPNGQRSTRLNTPEDRSTWQLSQQEMRFALAMAGWPEELHEQALSVSWQESRWSPEAVGDGGRSLGLFQLNAATWAPYCGVPAEWLLEPLTNAWCALRVYEYEQARGYPAWSNWSVKP